MIEWIKSLDASLLLAINGANSPFWDEVMWLISDKFIWFPLYLLLFVIVFRNYPLKHALLFMLIGFLAIGFTDFTVTQGFKNNFMRYRPSHNLILGDLLHFYEIKPGDFYKGGMYGFISGHAANSMVIALLFIKQLRGKVKFITPILLGWVGIISYSRMYLAVHYPTDIICGLIWGTGVAFLFYGIYKKLINRSKQSMPQESNP